MTEAEWLACDDAVPLLDWLSHGRPITTTLAEHERFPNGFRVTDRKQRLFACACCRSVWNHFTVKRCRKAVEVAERYADGAASDDDMARVRQLAGQAVRDVHPEDRVRSSAGRFVFGLMPLDMVRRMMASLAVDPPHPYQKVLPEEVMSAFRWGRYEGLGADFVRCLFGVLPFRPVAADLAWLTPTVVQLARGMYDARDFAAMPILADALQDAGCEDADVLGHCRGPGPHVRGCWVVDLVLGKA